MENKLTVIIKETGLNQAKTDIILKQLGGFYNIARQVIEDNKDIKVDNVDDLEGMKKAREARLKLKDIRVEADKVRAQLKEDSLRESKAVQGVYNVIEALIKPAEDYLLEQEKFAERIEAEKNMRIESERALLLSKYTDDVEIISLHPDKLSNDSFEKLLETYKIAHTERIKEEERIKKEAIILKEKSETFIQRKLSLGPISEFVNPSFMLNVDTQESEFNIVFNEAVKKKEEYDKKQEQIRQDNIKLMKEKELADKKREALEREIEKQKEKQRLELIKKQREEQKQKEKERQLELAPDKDKVYSFINSIKEIKIPDVTSKEAKELLTHFDENRKYFIDQLITEAKNIFN